MKHTRWLLKDKPLKTLMCVIIAGYGGQAVAADNGQETKKEETVIVTAVSTQGNDDEVTAVAHDAGAATKSTTPISRTPQSVSVITQAQMASQAVKTVTQALRYMAGVVAESSGSDSRFDTINVRGFEADEYLDGLRLPRNYWSRPGWDPYLLSRIEVVKGPTSVLYGQTSPGGVVNLVSKKPQSQPEGEVYISGGNYNQFGTGFDVTGPLTDDKTLLGRIGGTYFKTQTQVDNTRYEHYDIAPSLTWQPDDKTHLTVLAQLRKDPDTGFFNLLPTSGTLTTNPNGKIPTSFYGGQPDVDKYERKQASIGYQFDHQFNDNVTVRQNVRYISASSLYNMVYPWGTVSNAPEVHRLSMHNRETMTNLALDNQAQFRLSTGPVAHTLLTGVDYNHTSQRSRSGSGVASDLNYLDPDYSTPVTLPDFTSSSKSTVDQTGVYLQDQAEWNNWLLSLGGRYDYAKSDAHNLVNNTRSGTDDHAKTGRAGLLYHFDNGLAPYISYSTSFMPTSGTTYAGNAFKPTKGKQSEVGLKYDPVGLDALFTLALYDLKQTNVATADPDHANYSVQTGEIRSRGIEVEGKINITPEWLVLSSYALTSPEVTEANDATKGKRPIGISRNTARLWSEYAFRGGVLDGFSVGGGARYIGTSYANTTNTMKVPAVTIYDARLAYQWHQWGVALNAANLGNKTYLATCQNTGCWYGTRRQYVATLNYQW